MCKHDRLNLRMLAIDRLMRQRCSAWSFAGFGTLVSSLGMTLEDFPPRKELEQRMREREA